MHLKEPNMSASEEEDSGQGPLSRKPKKRSHSPTPSFLSMNSDVSKDLGIVFEGEQSSPQHPKLAKRSQSPTRRCEFMKSDVSKDLGIVSKEEESSTEQSERHKDILRGKYQHLTEGISKDGIPTPVSKIYTRLCITLGGRGCVHCEHEVRKIESPSGTQTTPGNPIEYSDIFKPLAIGPSPIRTVLTKGIAGIGKTVSVYKFIQDWAEGKCNQDIHYIFPLPFRGLNLVKDEKLSLVHLLQLFRFQTDSRIFSNTKGKILFIFDGLDECRLSLDFYNNQRCSDVSETASVGVLLINLMKGNLLPKALLWITTRPAAANQIPARFVDKVTEIRGFTDSQKEEYFRKRINNEKLASRTIEHLKSSGSLYIMCHIPVFSWLSATVLERILSDKTSRETPTSLTQMYTHFLIIQTSVKNVKYTEREKTKEMIFKLGKLAFQQLEKDHLIFYEEDLRECGIDVTEASVYSGVCTQIFREESLLCKDSVFSFVHLSIQEFLAALYVFLCFSNKEKNMPDQQQNSQLSALFRAATLHELHKTAVDLALQSKNGHLDLFLRFLLGLSLEANQNLLCNLLQNTNSQSQSSENIVLYVKQKIREDPSALIGTLRSNTGQLVNLFHCLNELNHHAVVEVIKISPTVSHLSQSESQTASLSVFMLLPGQRETRKFVFKTSEDRLVEFDLQKHMKTLEEGSKRNLTELLSPDEVLQKLVPVVRSSTAAELCSCNLTWRSCETLNSRDPSCLTELDLSHNDLQDAGAKHISIWLQTPHCNLEKLKLWNCNLTWMSCEALAEALSSPSEPHPSCLRELDLSYNDLQDAGVEQICRWLQTLHCRLENLKLLKCGLGEKSCAALGSALNTSLRQLDLSDNRLLNGAVQHLSLWLCSPHCRLEKLQLWSCNLTWNSCEVLAKALSSHPSSFRELDLSYNALQDAGVEHICSWIQTDHCKLEKLELWECYITYRGCAALASALRSGSSRLRELDLSENSLREVELQPLLNLSEDPAHSLAKLQWVTGNHLI